MVQGAPDFLPGVPATAAPILSVTNAAPKTGYSSGWLDVRQWPSLYLFCQPVGAPGPDLWYVKLEWATDAAGANVIATTQYQRDTLRFVSDFPVVVAPFLRVSILAIGGALNYVDQIFLSPFVGRSGAAKLVAPVRTLQSAGVLLAPAATQEFVMPTVTTGLVQVACPLDGNPISADVYLYYNDPLLGLTVLWGAFRWSGGPAAPLGATITVPPMILYMHVGNRAAGGVTAYPSIIPL